MADLIETMKDLIGMGSNPPMSSSTEASNDFCVIRTERTRSGMQLLRRVLVDRQRRRTHTTLNFAMSLTSVCKMYSKI